MTDTTATFRALLVLLLAIAVSISGIAPILASPVAAKSANGNRRVPPKVCCCGSDASCCGMACCAKPANRDRNEPTPVRNQVDQRNVLVLALARLSSVLSCALQGAALNAICDSSSDLSDPSTLQAEHVRIQT